jgi:hypothetical protein
MWNNVMGAAANMSTAAVDQLTVVLNKFSATPGTASDNNANNKFAKTFFSLFLMHKTIINTASGNGPATPCLIKEIKEYIASVIATAGLKQNSNSYNMQMKAFVQCIQEDKKNMEYDH